MNILPPEKCALDLLSLGECMIRLVTPEHQRIQHAKEFLFYPSGAEYNVAVGLSQLGLRSAWCGGLVDNPLGQSIISQGRAVGVDMDRAKIIPFDGVGRDARMGLHFGEVGLGPRASTTIYDRGHSAMSKLGPKDMDWDQAFAGGVRWFHTTGITPGLSESCRKLIAEAMKQAKSRGAMVSYDLNFRSKLWSSKEAIQTTQPLMEHIDVLIGNEEDFQKVLGYEVEGTDENLKSLPVENYKKMVAKVVKDYPHLSAVGTTLREVISASANHWSAILYMAKEKKFYQGIQIKNLQIEDRVGGGDGFAAGLIYGFLTGKSPQESVDLGTAHGALVQTTPGDASQATLKEVQHLASGGSARIQR